MVAQQIPVSVALFRAMRDGDVGGVMRVCTSTLSEGEAGHGHLWLPEAMTVAAKGGHIECMRLALRLGAAYSINTTLVAAGKGQLKCLKFAHESGAPWHHETTSLGGLDLACLIYSHENGAHWSPSTTLFHALNGYLASLIYAHEHGAPWHRLTTRAAAERGHLECLVYSHTHGAPMNPKTVHVAARRQQHACLAYAVEQGFPFSPSDPVIRKSDDCRSTVLKALTKRRRAKQIQRSWRARMVAKRRRAVSVIQEFYLERGLRPVSGSIYKRAKASFKAMVSQQLSVIGVNS